MSPPAGFGRFMAAPGYESSSGEERVDKAEKQGSERPQLYACPLRVSSKIIASTEDRLRLGELIECYGLSERLCRLMCGRSLTFRAK